MQYLLIFKHGFSKTIIRINRFYVILKNYCFVKTFNGSFIRKENVPTSSLILFFFNKASI